jgi:outer membrane receptor protein involved in Fe transport
MKPINRLVVGISLAMLVATPMSMAQVIEEITVTARKKSENLQDVPISVNVITSDILDRRSIRDLNDVTKLDPSLIFDKGFAPDDIRVVVRGIDNGRGRPVVATIIDGVDISSEALATAGASQLISPTLIDIERIEIVKGLNHFVFEPRVDHPADCDTKQV